MKDVEVVIATVDLDAVVTFRAAISSLREQASSVAAPQLLQCDFNLCSAGTMLVTLPVEPKVG